MQISDEEKLFQEFRLGSSRIDAMRGEISLTTKALLGSFDMTMESSPARIPAPNGGVWKVEWASRQGPCLSYASSEGKTLYVAYNKEIPPTLPLRYVQEVRAALPSLLRGVLERFPDASKNLAPVFQIAESG